MLTARNVFKLGEVAAACKSLSPKSNIIVLPLDMSAITDDDSPVLKQYMVDLQAHLSKNSLPGIDCLINNAGISSRGNALETSSLVLKEVMQTNFFGPVALTKAVVRDMLSRGRAGHIAVISSVQGLIGLPSRTCYAASKHALQGYFECFRAELSSYGIFVTSVSPGYINTSLSINAVTGDGSRHGKMDENTKKGMAASFVAREVLLGIAQKRSNMLICDIKSEAAIIGNTLFPDLMAYVLESRK